MLKLFKGTIIIVILLGTIDNAQAQKSTEIFIPIGKSVGLSGKHTTIGNIEMVNQQNQTIKVSDDSGSHTIQITEQTQIWLDKSKIKKSNQYGTPADCQEGRLVEVKYQNNDKSKPAEWIKVEVGEGA